MSPEPTGADAQGSPGLWARLRALVVHQVTLGLHAEIGKFLIVGGLNFLLTLAVFFTLVRVLGIHHLLGLVGAWLVGMPFSYALNFTWVFKTEARLRFKARFGRFLLASVVSLLLNLAALELLVRATAIDPFLIQCGLIPLIVVFNFATAKLWSLRKTHASVGC